MNKVNDLLYSQHKHFYDNNYICHNGCLILEVNTEGDVLPCCPDWHNFYKFGNIYSESIENIINSEKARIFRRSILNGTYEFCNKNSCMSHSIPKEEIKKYILDDGSMNSFVETIRFAHERSCNLKCITCRNDYIFKDKNTEILNELVEKTFVPLASNAKCVHLNTNGEVFASSHCEKLLKALVQNNKNIKFDITSNGVLFTKENCVRLGILNSLNDVGISVHAATKETYNKITGSTPQSNNFEKVFNNIEFLLDLKKQGMLRSLQLIFVVHKYNYKEMIDFLNLPIIRNNNIPVMFWEYRPWSSSSMSEDYEDVAVWLKNNKEYKNFKKIISNKIFDSENCKIPALFSKIRCEQKQNLFGFFKWVKNDV